MPRARTYRVPFANTPAAASSTVPVLGLNGASTVRLRLYDMTYGSDTTPANAAAQFQIVRITTALGSGTAITPRPDDTADPASTTTAMQGPSIAAPTITANSSVYENGWPQLNNIRHPFQEGYEVVAPATSNNGLALIVPVINGTAWDFVGTWFFSE